MVNKVVYIYKKNCPSYRLKAIKLYIKAAKIHLADICTLGAPSSFGILSVSSGNFEIVTVLTK